MADRAGRWLDRLRASSLGAKLALLGALLTAGVVGGTFIVLRIGTERSVRQVFVNELHASQAALQQIQANSRRLLLQTAVLVSGTPTLRAALDASRADSALAGSGELRVATIKQQVDEAFRELDADLLVITDDSGQVVTSASTVPGPSNGSSLRSLPAVQSALFGQSASADSAFGVLSPNGLPLDVVAVPLLVHGFPVGALILGKRIDRIVPPDSSLDTHEIVASGGRILASNLSRLPARAGWQPRWSPGLGAAGTLAIGDEEYVAATLPLGATQEGHPVDLYLLRSLTAAIDPIDATLTERFLVAGLLAVVLVGGGGALLSRTTLRPLSRFVGFMQAGTGANGFALFNEPHAPREIAALTNTYNALIESLEAGHVELRHRTKDLAKANRRLNRQITRREQVEQALRDSEDQLRQAQKLEALGALAGGVAHDFNNILSIILGYAEIVKADLPPDSVPRADVTKISDAAMRARTLVRQLLAFSRKQVLQPQVLDLNDVVTGVEPLMRPLLGEGVVVELKLAPDLARVTADPGQIEQVIINLAVNARDAMPNGGRLLIETENVTLDARAAEYPVGAGPAVLLAVSDTGIGMDAETRRRIFEPFFTTKPVGVGTGLGLATVYGIVRQSEGNITVFTEPGRGSVFRCYFPVAGLVEAATHPATSTEASPRGAETILIAEDELELRALMRRALARQGYTVLEAGHGAEALDVAAAHSGPIHLLVTDVIMPGVSGTELAERLSRARPGLRVMYISGYSDEAIERHGVLTPDSVYLQKPVTPDALSHAVRNLLDGELVSRETE